jgi:hypothetical protein
MKRYFALILPLLLLGCAFNPQPPCLVNIKNRPYIAGGYTCLGKSRDASQCLVECGYDAWVIHGPIRGLGLHAWVEIRHEGKVYWLDPTWDIGCYEKNKWTDRRVEAIYKWTGKEQRAKECGATQEN